MEPGKDRVPFLALSSYDGFVRKAVSKSFFTAKKGRE